MKNNKVKYLEIIEKQDKPGLPVKKRVVAVVVFYDGKGNVLCQERRSISKAGEEWGLFGGGIEKGENPEQGLKRELDEEITGLPTNLQFEKIAKMRVFYYNPKENFYRDLDKHVFACKLPLNLKIKVLEGNSARWFTFAEAKKLKMIPGNIEAIEILGKKWIQNEKF